MSEPTYEITDSPKKSSGGSKTNLLFALIGVLAVALGYQYYQVGQLRIEMAQSRESLMAEISKVHETSAISAQTNKRSVDAVKDALTAELEAARRQANQLAGQAKVDATKHADELATKLTQIQEEQAKKVSAVTAEVTEVKSEASANKGRIGEVSGEVGTLRTEQAATKSELEKTIADLRSTRGDLGVQSGLIATNSKELSALRALGERNYTEFKLGKQKTTQRIGDVAVRLKSADPKKNRYTIELVADDKLMEKKDKTINEPVQFYLARAAQPYELVVNEVRKDLIAGYISGPKVQQPRK